MKILKVMFVVLIFAFSAYAQTNGAKLQGTVTDVSHAPVPGARITLTDTLTGVVRTTTTGTTGEYIFNVVIPGTYSVGVDATGFKHWMQAGIQVETLGDVTVSPVLAVGSVTQTVQVAATTHAMELHSSSIYTTINGTMLRQLPVMSRNPTTLALLNPNVVNEYSDVAHRFPFFSAAGSGLDFGGGTEGRNDVLLDGVSTVVNFRTGYTPAMDNVAQVVSQVNAVDAQFGSSAGGIITMTTKSGTNQWHGTAYYFGRNPSLDAVSNAVTRTPNTDLYNIFGVNMGGPIKKNKMFIFGAYEKWHSSFPASDFETLPTTAERNGDFSQQLNQFGTLDTIYDPYTTTTNPVTGVITRTPYPGNIIPANLIDPTAMKFMQDVWQPNNPGAPYTHENNFALTYDWWSHYDNWSGRWDYDPNDHWSMFYRYSQFREWESNNDFVNSPAFPDADGGLTATINSVGGAVYTINPTTLLDMRYGLSTYGINYGSPWAGIAGGEAGYAKFWPNNPWYKPIVSEDYQNGYYYPSLTVGTYSAGFAGLWYSKTRKESFDVTLMKHAGRHDMKFGWSLWHQWEAAMEPTPFEFSATADGTAATYESPNLTENGNAWATFLMGGVQDTSEIAPIMHTSDNEWAGFFQDDFQVNSRLTLQLGLRDEYEGGFTEAQNRMGQTMNFGAPISYMQANPPVMPSQVTQYGLTPKYDGLWQFATPSNPKVFGVPRLSLQPRLGMALHITKQSVLRVGYARFAAPFLDVVGENWGIPSYGYTATSTMLPYLEGIPQATMSNPFPSTNPLVMAEGDSLGGYTNIGNPASWFDQSAHPPIDDRIDADYQFMLPDSIRMDVSSLFNFGHNYQPPATFAGTYQENNLNMLNPELTYTYKSALDQEVPNPFYNYGTPQDFPGALRYEPEVAVSSLLVPYPQYGALDELMIPGFSERYQSLQVEAERPFSHGLTFIAGYAYIHEKYDQYFNDLAEYAESPSMVDSANPRHRITAGGVWNLPVGRGRTFLSHAPGVVNAILGGWNVSNVFMWNSGDFLRFGQMIATGNPVIPQPTPSHWFNTADFQVPLPYTPRTNPYQYPGLTGPRYYELDSSISKSFPLTERFNLVFRFAGYNILNNFVPSDPDTNIDDSTFGMSTSQANAGREMEYSLRLNF